MNQQRIRVYYEDTDAGGVVFYANYLKYIERGRTEYLRDLGFEQGSLAKQHGMVFVVKSVSADYLSPAYLDDVIEVQTSIDLIKNASLVFAQKILNIEKNTVLFKAEVKVYIKTSQNLLLIGVQWKIFLVQATKNLLIRNLLQISH